ncbi:unnamed protein product [Allacma fusca]|uniref:Uncharacterized protein n=1 Tax=Allacma fusca TaxID=39272 RepID=A0A8J2KHX6_9HEXA|nr:unnamed protein product [Allacma fusca]
MEVQKLELEEPPTQLDDADKGGANKAEDQQPKRKHPKAIAEDHSQQNESQAQQTGKIKAGGIADLAMRMYKLTFEEEKLRGSQ